MKVILETAAMVIFGAGLVGTLILGTTGSNKENSLRAVSGQVMQQNIDLLKAIP